MVEEGVISKESCRLYAIDSLFLLSNGGSRLCQILAKEWRRRHQNTAEIQTDWEVWVGV